MELNVIYARARNGVIGLDGAMPWHIGEDMAHFRSMTLGNVVIMGRKTYQSLPGPLSGRINVVVSRSQVVVVTPEANTYRAASFKEALAIAERVVAMKSAREIWVIGGAEIYNQALPLATRVEVTEIDADFKGDTHMLKLGREWKEVSRSDQTTAAGIPLSFVSYERRPGGNRFFQAAGRYVFWLFLVQLVAWSPAILNAFDVVGLTTSAMLSIALSTAGAIWLIDLAKSGMCQLHSRFQPANPKE